MPHSFGYRARTRHMFKRGFKGARNYIGILEEAEFLIQVEI